MSEPVYVVQIHLVFLHPHPKHYSHTEHHSLLPKAMDRNRWKHSVSAPRRKRCIWKGKVSTQGTVKQIDISELQRKENLRLNK